MKPGKWIFIAISSTVLLNGCAIHQKISPVASMHNKEICIIENRSVRESFLESYRNALEAKGYIVKTLHPDAMRTECGMTSTYKASWRWDLALYMAYAEIKVYGEGKPIGDALYDAQTGGGNLGKFISADSKIRDLVNLLFPK